MLTLHGAPRGGSGPSVVVASTVRQTSPLLSPGPIVAIRRCATRIVDRKSAAARRAVSHGSSVERSNDGGTGDARRTRAFVWNRRRLARVHRAGGRELGGLAGRPQSRR